MDEKNDDVVSGEWNEEYELKKTIDTMNGYLGLLIGIGVLGYALWKTAQLLAVSF